MEPPRPTALCHCCLEPSPHPLPYPCERGCDSARYCSAACRDEDRYQQHTAYRCRFLSRLQECGGGSTGKIGVQIAVAGEAFPEYSCPPKWPVRGARDVGGRRSDFPPAGVEATGRDLRCRLGDEGDMVLFPDQIDAGGSALIRIVVDGKDRHVLCDIGALCVRTPAGVDERNKSEGVWAESLEYWISGVDAWYNDRDYIFSIECFQNSLGTIEWLDDKEARHMEEGDDEHAFHAMMLCPPPIRNCPQQRSELARRAYFLGACLLDADRNKEGRVWLARSLRTAPPPEPVYHEPPPICREQNAAAMELALSYEEEGLLSMARSVAEWTVDIGIGEWSNGYQRPGYIYVGEMANGATSGSSTPYFPRDQQPSWCRVLEEAETFDVILKEFTNLLVGIKTGPAIAQPTHWPAVGSGEHRDSGYNDHRVVAGGDWREHVLFGSGASSSADTAPKTKALLRKVAPGAVSLAESGGGEVIFSVLAPGTHITPHCASTNVRLTAHLGLVIPSNGETKGEHGRPRCGIRVGGEWRTWQRGKMLVFDDSFEHSVRNDSDQLRAVLLIRFWNPDIPFAKREVVISSLQQMKAVESSRRYNPPLPVYMKVVEKRGLGITRCRRCFASGYESVRLNRTGSCYRIGNVIFTCTCGADIQ